jgi:hypothetical protein
MTKAKSARSGISAVFQFNKSGALKSIYLNAEGEEDQKVLEQGLFVLLKPEKFASFKKLFRGLKG